MLEHSRKTPLACGITACVECSDNRCTQCAPVPDWLPSWLGQRGFYIDEKGHCYLPFEKWLVRIGLTLLVALVAVLVLAAVAQFLVVRFHASRRKAPEAVKEASAPLFEIIARDTAGLLAPAYDAQTHQETVDRSTAAINHGLASWRQRQMMHWKPDMSMPEPYGCSTNVSKMFIIGVGLPLFYGFQALVLASAVLVAIVLFVAQSFSGVVGVYKEGKTSIENGNVTIDVPEMAILAQNMFYALGFLYVCLVGLSYRHAVFQRKFKQFFDMTTSCMADFTVHLEGLPSTCTCEADLKAIVEENLDCRGKVVGVSIGYDLFTDKDLNGKVFDMWEHLIVLADTDFKQQGLRPQLVAEGWGYDRNLARSEAVDEKADGDQFRRLCKEEKGLGKRLAGSGHAFVVFKSKSDVDNVCLKFHGMWVRSEITPKNEVEVQAIRSAIGPSHFEGVPMATIISGVDRLSAPGDYRHQPEEQPEPQLQTFARLNQRVVVGRERLEEGTMIHGWSEMKAGQKVKVERLVKVVNDSLEPTSTEFWNFGKTMEERAKVAAQTMWVLLLTFLVIVILVYFPLFYWLTNPHGIVQSAPGWVASQLQGVMLGIAGNVLGTLNWNWVCRIGHTDKPERDLYFVRFSTFTNFFNTFFFLGAGLYLSIQEGFNQVDMTPGGRVTAEDVVKETHLWRNFYYTLIPGWLFSGVITGKLMGWFVPVVQNWVLVNVVFTAKFLPEAINKVLCAIIPWNPPPGWLSARSAEHIFEPPEVALAWEYGQYVVTPSVCCMGLFVMTPQSWKVFLMLALWTAFMYILHRFPTLKISKKQMASGAQLQALAEKLWGFPLAVILAAWGFWGIRCEKLGNPEIVTSYWIVLFLFVLGLLAHSWLLTALPNYETPCFDTKDTPYEHVVGKLHYTWFNVNPVHVLKTRYCREELGDHTDENTAWVPFEYGKEYLQLLTKFYIGGEKTAQSPRTHLETALQT